MKQKLLRVTFAATVLVVWLTLALILVAGIEVALPVRRRPDGLYPSTNRTPLVVVASAFAGWLANSAVSRLFAATGLSPERWSIFRRRV